MSDAIPNEWVQCTLSDIAEVRLGRQRSPKQEVGEHLRPYMRAANVTWLGISVHDVKEMNFTPAEAEVYELRDGDILLSEASGSPSEVGKPAIWRDEVPGACFQNTLIRVRADQTLTRFLHLHFLQDAVTGAFARSSRGVGIHHLGAKAMSDWQVSLPPLGEQARLADAVDSYLSRLDAAVAGLKRVQANLKRYRASVLKAAVEGRLVPTEAALAKAEGRTYEPASKLLARILEERRARWEAAELASMKAKGKPPKDDKWKSKYQDPAPPNTKDLPELPEGWCWATTGQLVTHVTSGSRDWTRYYGEGDSTFLMAQNVRPGRLDLTFKQPINPPPNDRSRIRSQVEEGDLLVTIVGANTGDVCRVTDALPRHYVCQSVALMRPAVTAVARYIELALCSPVGQAAYDKFMYGQGRPHLSFDNLQETPVPLPPLVEQSRILDDLDSALSLEEHSEATVATSLIRCSRLRQSILKWAFEGKLVDQDPSDEPVSALLDRIRAEREAATRGNGTRTKKKASIKGESAPSKRQRKKAAGA